MHIQSTKLSNCRAQHESVYRHSDLKCPYRQFFLFSYQILYITQWTSAKEKFDLDKMQSLLAVLNSFKFAAILVHHSHQSSLRFEWVVT